MIEAVPTPQGVVVGGDLVSGASAYFDAEWVPRARAAIPALVIETDTEDGADQAAVRAFALFADHTVEQVRRREPASVEITGTGAVAALVGARLRALGLRVGRHERPAMIVDTTGSAAQIAEACQRLADFGTLVLAGEPTEGTELDLYSDLHVRGLTAVGVPRPRARSDGGGAAVEQGQLELLRTALRRVEPGRALLADGLWYCVRRSR